MLTLAEFAASSCPSQLVRYPGRCCRWRHGELHWLHWFACRAELGELLGNLGGCSEVGGAALGTPEQCNTSLDGEGEILLPWRPMTQLNIGCHGNQFGSLWAIPHVLVPRSWGWRWSMWCGMAGMVRCFRAGLSPCRIPQNELPGCQTGTTQPQTGELSNPNWSIAGWWGQSCWKCLGSRSHNLPTVRAANCRETQTEKWLGVEMRCKPHLEREILWRPARSNA